MALRSILRWTTVGLLTVGLVASIVTMFVMRGAWDEIWVYASSALYGLGLLVYWLIAAGSKPGQSTTERDEVDAKVAAGVPRTPAVRAEPEPEIVVEPSRTEPIVLPTPLVPKPAAYAFRGYALYARGETRFFSKATPPGAHAIDLPDGFEAKWDTKKGKPVLVEAGEAEPERASVVRDAQRKACCAMTSPGEFCENFAKEGSKYCMRHADSGGVDELIEVRKPGRAGAGKSARFVAPQIEVRLGKPEARPFVPKKPHGGIDVRVARPSNTKPIEYKRGKAVEVQGAKPSTKPFKPRATGDVFVQLAKPKAGRPLRSSTWPEPTVRVARPSSVKPLRIKAAAEPVVRTDHGSPRVTKRKMLAPSEVVVKKPGAARSPAPLKVSNGAFVVQNERRPKRLDAKPIRVKEPEIVVVRDSKQRSMLGVSGDGPKARRRP